jgi:NAD+ synthetase
MDKYMKIALAQLNPTVGDLVGNAAQILAVAEKVAAQGVRLLLTPELAICGYPPRDLLLNPSFIEQMHSELENLAQSLPTNLAVLVGTVVRNRAAHQRGEKPLFNSSVLLQAGKIEKIFYKRLLPTYDVFDEDRYFESGKVSDYFTLDNLKIGVSICEDVWNNASFWGKRNYEVDPIADLAQLGVDLIVNLSASPYSIDKQKLREEMLSHCASYYGIPMLYTNQVGGNDDLIFDGQSVAFNRCGEVVYRAPAFGTTVQILEYRQDLLHQEIYPLASSSEEEIFQALVLGVKDYARKCGFTQAILGLSGGIDSALVAVIATQALGKENVLGVLMPSPYSSAHSVNDALILVENLGIKSQLLPIGELMQGYDRLLEPLFTGTDFGIAEENIQSRIRGNILMAIANKFGYLLLSTGNKSEIAVGYCTLYGDMNGGLAVIADVPKTRVFSLCRWLNRHQELIPNNILVKPPSAELKPNQLDQDSLPPYEILDAILERLIEQHQSAAQIIAEGYAEVTVKKIIKLITRAEFKRKQAPPGLKISDRAFGTGWRMPIASRWFDVC